MDEFGNIQLTSPPSSLPDGLISAQGTVPPIPRPRRGSTSSFSSSTAKQHLSFIGSLTRGTQSNSVGSSFNRNTSSKGNKIHRTPSVDSSGSCDVKVIPLSNMLDNSDADTEEEENNNQHGNSSEKLNSSSSSNSRSKKSHPRYVSRSLPVTPRVNGNCSNAQSQNALNSGISSSFVSGIGGSSTPLLLAPHLTPNFPLEGSFNSIGSLSPVASQYVTCSSGIMSESHDKILPGSIDYSSLPLQREESFRLSNKRHISRHMSEPCIHEIPNRHLATTGKCHSCPQKKISSKHKRRESAYHYADSESLGRENLFRNSFSGVDTKSDDVETIEMQWKFIKTLIDELNKCRCQSNRMAVELHQSKMEIQMLKGALDAYSEAGVQPGILTEMVGQIHAAQKIRDEAMMSRIKLANEERDAALAQTHALLEKLGLSPRAPLDNFNFNVFSYKDQDKDNFQTPPTKANEEGINLSAVEEELKALRLALHIQDAVQDRLYPNESSPLQKGKDGEGESQEILDELKTKLSESEVSRMKLQERCSRLERVFGCLRRKVNGLNAVDGVNLTPTTLTFLDMSVFSAPETNNNNSNNNNDSESSPYPSTVGENSPHGCKRTYTERGRRGAEGEGGTEGDSISSVESMETPSAMSWKHVCSNHNNLPNSHVQSTDATAHPPLTLASSQPPTTSHSYFTSHSSDRGGGSEQVSCCFSKSSSVTRDDGVTNCSPRESSLSERNSNAVGGSKGDFKTRNLGGVTLMGPITEL